MSYQNPYSQPNPYPYAQPGKKWTGKDWLVKVILPILGICATILGALIAAGIFPPKPAATIPILSSSYSGTMIRNNDNARFNLSLDQITENQTGDFTASATINLCPAEVSGNVKVSGSISFTATESTACQDQGLIGSFTGNVHSANGTVDSMSGSWNTNNGTVEIVGTWSLQ